MSPSDALREGRRALEGIKGVILLEDWTWYQQAGRWALKARLSLETPSGGPMPCTTDWYTVVEDIYPWGEVIFYPATEGGITQTFPHQNCNARVYRDRPWRKGRLCVDTSMHALGRSGYDIEPFDAGQRLAWHFPRALEWLEAAAQGTLVQPGDPFETPQYPRALTGVVAFNESPESLEAWRANRQRRGIVTLRLVDVSREATHVTQFQTLDGRLLVVPEWGLTLSGSESSEAKGGWILLDSIPALEPWQAPTTWGELRAVCGGHGVSLDDHLRPIASRLRDGREHILLLGAPIPAKVGEPARQLHWLALMLPVLTADNVKGFRPNDEGYWRRDRSVVIPDDRELRWMDSENWFHEELSGRGKLPDELTKQRVVVLGAGAIGSALANQLVRAGTFHVTVLDGDTLEAGNLVRHTLGLDSLGMNKAAALATTLNNTSPHAAVVGVPEYFPPAAVDARSRVQEADIIIDCTAKDDALARMEAFDWGGHKIFVSLSLGMWAKRLFVFSCSALAFPHSSYIETIRPWLEKDLGEHAGTTLPREGIGCWHPVFPAGIGDIEMMCAMAIKELEHIVASPPLSPQLVVFEQEATYGVFNGVRRLSGEHA